MRLRINPWMVFVILTSLFFNHNCYAAEGGARPISMGGAFVALADDVHAASWNPAGLAWQQNREVTYSGVINNRNDFIPGDFVSDDYLCYAQPLKMARESDYDQHGGIGFYFFNSSYQNQRTKASTLQYQPGFAYGRKFTSNENMSWGASLNYYYFESEIPGQSDSDAAVAINLGYLWYLNDSVTVGFLWENVNEPDFSLHGVKGRLVRVLRPGVAYYFDDTTVGTLDIYDLTGNTDDRGNDYSQNIRLGLEHYFSDEFSARGGIHHPNTEVDTSRFYTIGLGWQRSDFFNAYPVSYYFDYTFVYWDNVPTGMEEFTHQLGMTVKF